jgi:hypothetical protein
MDMPKASQGHNLIDSVVRYVKSRSGAWNLIALVMILAFVVLVSKPTMLSPDIDDLDSAHHLVDGYFFRDLIVDHPTSHLEAYALGYYKQYPAMGFIFWPPFFSFVLGLFCMVGGTHVLTARVCLLFFGVVFSWAFYAILRRRFSIWLSFSATIAAIVMPGLAWDFNQIMLEMPTLAMMCLAVLAYFHVIDHLEGKSSIGRGLLCGFLCAAVIYTKQPAWFLYPALMVDFLLLHRRFAAKAEVLVTIVTTFVLCLPLVAFTLTYGRADLSQAVIQDPRLKLALNNHYLPRWSIEAWTFYPNYALSLVSPTVLLLLVGAIVYAFWNSRFRREYALWLAWFVLGYLTLSYYDNRRPRFAAFWWPSLIVLAAGFLWVMMERVPRKWAWALPLLLWVPVPFQLHENFTTDYTDYRGVQPPIDELFALGNPGNILTFGYDKQVFVAIIREHDVDRQVHIVRGERLLATGATLADVCRRYRIQTVLIELTPIDSMDNYKELSNTSLFKPIEKSSFLRRRITMPVLGYRYLGPIDATMADIPLSKDLL